MRSPIRVLVVDDSLVMRSLLRAVLASEPLVEIIGMASDGAAALEAIDCLKPDLVLLDIEMPRMNGLEVLAALRKRNCGAKVIICSMLTQRGAGITLDALAQGASDYVTKPTGKHGPGEAVAILTADLMPKIQALFSSSQTETFQPVSARQKVPLEVSETKHISIVAIGVSTGGPEALENLLSRLPGNFPVPILVVQHMPQVFTALLAQRLDRDCALTVKEAAPGDIPEAGTVYIARGGWHMELLRSNVGSGCSLRLSQSEPSICRPSVDVLLRSLADRRGSGVLAIVLTGMGTDGLEGCRQIRNAGGRVLVQDRDTSVVWGMPGAIADAGLAHRVLTIPAIAAEMMRLCPAPELLERRIQR